MVCKAHIFWVSNWNSYPVKVNFPASKTKFVECCSKYILPFPHSVEKLVILFFDRRGCRYHGGYPFEFVGHY